MVGYGRLRGPLATQRLAEIYDQARWFINGFQPSFKLISTIRDGARVRKQCDSPKMPWERLLAAKVLSEAQAQHLQAVYRSLDPIALQVSPAGRMAPPMVGVMTPLIKCRNWGSRTGSRLGYFCPFRNRLFWASLVGVGKHSSSRLPG